MTSNAPPQPAPGFFLAVNAGSSSIKCALVDLARGERVVELAAMRLGSPQARIRGPGAHAEPIEGVEVAQVVRRLIELALETVRKRGTPEAVVHRVVHGGERFQSATRFDDGVRQVLAELAALAPLHNPASLQALAAAQAVLPDVPHVLCFDTAFHRTLPARARTYAIPAQPAEAATPLRRFGFHGLNHAWVARAAARHLRTTPATLRIVSCHLGSGASLCAVEYGTSTETSMGLTPLEGLVMATRAGDLDPGILLQWQRAGLTTEQIEERLYRGSGLLALAGSAEMQEIETRAAAGDEGCRLALAVFAHRVRKYIGAYAASLGGVDVIVFTGGIGENSAGVRHRCLQRLDFLGAVIDEEANRDAVVTRERPVIDISAATSRVRLLVVAADEEHEMALEAQRLLHPASPRSVPIPVAVSARHAHLSQATIDAIFGPGHQLRVRRPLHQPGQFAAEEVVSLIGPAGRIDGVRLIGPPRREDQIEISRSEEFTLGVDAPLRISGDLQDSPGIGVEGPLGRIQLARGVICARRHVHLSVQEAARLGLADGQRVAVRVGQGGRDLVFQDVQLRVAGDFAFELHLDTDEANAAGVRSGDTAELLLGPASRA